MSPTTYRRLLLLALVAVCALAVLVSCTTIRVGGYLWQFDASQPVCERVVWRQVERNRIPGLCSDLRGRAAREGASCALGCLVLSPYSEAEAKRHWLFGETLYEHEQRHVMERMVHP